MGFAQDVAGMFGGTYSGADNISAGQGGGSGFDSDGNALTGNSSSGISQSGLAGGLGLLGLGLSAFGTASGVSAAQQSAQAGMNIAGLEQKVNDQRQLAMQITARRQQMQTIRTNQMAQAQATAAATNQGAQFGSGLQGGLAGVEGQSASNLQGINQQLQTGNNIFGLDNQISQQKIAQYQAQSQEATASGVSSFGGDLLKAAPMIASLALG